MIEYIADVIGWAIAASPFMLGFLGGGGGGGSPQPPQLNPQQSAELFEKQLQLQQKYLPGMAATAGTAARGQDAEAVRFGLGMLTNPGATIYGSQISSLNRRNADAQKQIAELQKQLQSGSKTATTTTPSIFGRLVSRQVTTTEKLSAAQRRSIEKQIASLQRSIKSNEQRISSYRDPSFTDRQLRRALPQEFAARDRLLGDINRARASSPEYQRAQAAMARGLRAQQTDAGSLGNQLMQEAMDKVAQGGKLSPEASRDAVQAARSGMAARGMATGNAALGAELLNRDRFARQREMENLAFARGVQTEDLARRQTNTAMRADTDRFNIGLLGQASQMSDVERARQLSLGQDAYNFGLSTNPRMMLAGLGSPYANMTAPAMSMVSGAQGLQPMYSGGGFSRPGIGANLGMAAGGALSGAAAGAMLGSVVPGIGTAVGAIGGALLGGAGGYVSDKREKTDIKPLGTLSNVLKIPAYEYRYKGEKKKRRGVMAQDVQKVLPEAVAEVDYKGKKRLAIKPDVIGAALAQELTEQSKAVAA